MPENQSIRYGMKDIFAPTLRATTAAVFIIMTMATASSAAVTSCVPEGAPGDAPPPAKKTPIQLVLQPTRTMPIRGILTCRDVYGLRLGSSTMNSAVHSTGLDIGIPFSSSSTTSGMQLSLFGSSSGAVTGLQLGGIYNYSEKLRGIQIAPVINIAGVSGKSYGMQAGFINVSEQLRGIQIAPVINITAIYGKSYGMQAGFINFSDKELHGLQVGFINLSSKTEFQVGAISGAGESIVQTSLLANIVFPHTARWDGSVFVQLGGAIVNYAPKVKMFQGISSANIADELTGMQLGAANVTYDRLTGIQLGVLNIASRELLRREPKDTRLTEAAGVQIGLINMAESIHGLQIGFVNSAANLKGVQIGALNINRSGPLKFMPLVNIGF